MLTELYGKGGRVCQPAREGRLRCPLIVRPTSEDVITGHLCLVLRAIEPRQWLPELLNTALGTKRFRSKVFRNLTIEPWQNQQRYPVELLPWSEGSTQVDLTIRWENPPSTVFIETKFLASPSANVQADSGEHGYPSDQIIRNIRVGLQECGWLRRPTMFTSEPRDFVFVLLGPQGGNPLVHRYRSTREVRSAIPHGEKLVGLPPRPFVGELSYEDLRNVLRAGMNQMSRPERVLVDTFSAYLGTKQRLERAKAQRQEQLPGLDGASNEEGEPAQVQHLEKCHCPTAGSDPAD